MTIEDLKERKLPPSRFAIMRQNRKASHPVTFEDLWEALHASEESMKRYTRHYVRDHKDDA